MKRLLCHFVVLSIVTAQGWAHEGHSEPEPPTTPPTKAFPAAIVLPSIEGPKPWSDKPLLNDPDRFQIAIVTDRTGGHRPGIWMDAVRKLNLLRPEFVVSVGDLIEGYTENESRIEREWNEFLGFIDQLQMKFFFVAGNHDVTNPLLHEKWRERFGREWYSFDYRGVHFLCLCSEDQRQQHISEEQLEFVKADLAEHADARWTLVFLHKPLWTYAERAISNGDADPTNWKRVEGLLVDRPHTIFSGHVHHYVQYQRNGRDYYSLATTGGGSQLRGNEYGEFDHITWLTMEADGPHVANVRLDGILPPDIVTEQSAERFGDFLRGVRIEVAPILVGDASGFTEGEIRIRVTNEFEEEVTVSGVVDGLPLRGLRVEPDGLRVTAVAGEESEQRVRVRFDEPIEFDALRRATFTAMVRSKPNRDEIAPLAAERIVPVVIDQRHDCPKIPAGEAIDAITQPWPERAYALPEQPIVLGDAKEWTGKVDGSFEVAARHDGERLILSALVTDERVVAGKDRFEWILDARPANERLDPRLRWGVIRVTASAPGETGSGAVEVTRSRRRQQEPIRGAEGTARRTDAGYEIEVAIPHRALARYQGGQRWKDFQLAAVQVDIDDPSREPTEIVWRGTSKVRQRNTNYARFVRGK